MSQENVEIVRAFLDSYNRGDLDNAFQHLHPDIEIRGYDGGVSRGWDASVAGFLGWREQWKEFTSELEEFIDLGGDRAVVVCHSSGVGKHSGIEIDMHAGEIWTFGEGKITSMVLYRDRGEALEAAGLQG
jgi:ketosteroid isomerase-like protein